MWHQCCLCVKSNPRVKNEPKLSFSSYDNNKPSTSQVLLTITENEGKLTMPKIEMEKMAELAESEVLTGLEEKSGKNSLFSIDELAPDQFRSRHSSAKSFNLSQLLTIRSQGSISSADNKKNSGSLVKKNSLNLSRKSEGGISATGSIKKFMKKSSFTTKKDIEADEAEENKDVVSQLPKPPSLVATQTNRLQNLFMNKFGLSSSNNNNPANSETPGNDSNYSQDNSRRGSLYIFRNTDEPIVTPFAQILASLRKVRTNFVNITLNNKEPQNTPSKNQPQREDSNQGQSSTLSITENQGNLANETLRELEWCLDRLENIQTHRSVSDMASSKFKKLLNKELSQFASDGTKSGSQISEYICSTFLDSTNDPEVLYNTNELLNQETIGPLLKKEKARFKANEKRAEQAAKKNNSTRLDILARNCDLHVGVKAEFVAKVQGIGVGEEKVPKYGVNKTEKIEDFFEKYPLDRWGMDVFELAKITEHPLTCISFSILKEREIFEKFNISPWNAIRYFMLVEYHYNSKVPYHNSIHAADVVQSTNVLLEAPALNSIFSDLELFAVILACAVHDVDHPGVTNQYLINTNDSLAVLYNDSSVLENHHLAVAFTLLNQNGCDLTGNLTKGQRTSFRRMIIDMVLATDMSKHMDLLADLKTMVETKKVSEISVLNLDKYPNRIQILQNMVHCADLSNPTKPLCLYQQWTSRIMEEFFFQGDLERAAGLDISPMCDRETASLEQTQVSFINLIVHPLWETWTELVHPYGQDILELLESNREWYSRMNKKENALVIETEPAELEDVIGLE